MEVPFNPEDYYWVRWSNGTRYYVRATNKIIAKAKIPSGDLSQIPEKDKLIQAQDLFVKIREVENKIRFWQKYSTDPQNFSPDFVQNHIEKAKEKHRKLKDQYQQFPEDLRRQISAPLGNDGFYTVEIPGYQPKYQPKIPQAKNSQPKIPQTKIPQTKIPKGPFTFSPKDPLKDPFNFSSSTYSAFFKRTNTQFHPSYFDRIKVPKIPPKASPKVPPGQAPPPKIQPGQTQKDRELLQKFGIKDSKDWKQWMRQHHPDKNPNTNLGDVQEVNAAAQRLFN